MMAKSKQNESLKNIFEELEKLSDWFGRDDIDIDEALEKYKRGMELVKAARTHLKTAENEFKKVEKLAER